VTSSNVPVRWIRRAVSAAKQRAKGNYEFDITAQDMVDQWREQNGDCYWFQVPMGFVEDHPYHPLTPSLDKVDPYHGYTFGNVVWACLAANTAKRDTDPDCWEDFLDLVGVCLKEVREDKEQSQDARVRINWDMDGVLVQLHEATIQEYNRRYDHNITTEDSRVYHIADTPGIRCSREEVWEIIAGIDYANIEPYPDMIRLAREFACRGVESAIISSLTWFPPNTHAMQKREWIRRVLGREFSIIFTHDKHWCCRSPGDILIDDKAETVAKWPGRGILLERPWNRDERAGIESCPPEQLRRRLLELAQGVSDE